MLAAPARHATNEWPGSSPAGRGPTFVRHTPTQDIDQHTEQLLDWDLRYDQLDCGRFSGHFTDVRWPGVQLFMESTTRRVRQRGRLQSGAFGSGLLLRGAGTVSVNGARSGVGSLLACDATELDVCTPTDCTLIGLVIDADALRRAASRMNEPHLLDDGALVSMTPPESALAPWRGLLLHTLQAAAEDPVRVQDPAFQKGAGEALLAGLVDVLAAACRSEQVLPADRRKRIVDRACDLLLSQPDAPPSMFEVCSQLGASPRKLGYCFQDVLGVSPLRYIKAMRLNAVRRELTRSADPRESVYDVAARWGFWHFGHFSADYKKQFQELPSETLRRARGHAQDACARTDPVCATAPAAAPAAGARIRQASNAERLRV